MNLDKFKEHLQEHLPIAVSDFSEHLQSLKGKKDNDCNKLVSVKTT